MLHEIIRDEDVGYSSGSKELKNPRKRAAARGIVLNADNKIALLYKKNMNEYKLPGGGLEENESEEDAFCREVLEETGCKVEIISKLGITEEFKSKSNFYQISHIFLAKVAEDTHALSLTEKETAEGGMLLWFSPDDALEKVRNCYKDLKQSPIDETEDLYATRFVVKRDSIILDYYNNMIKTQNIRKDK